MAIRDALDLSRFLKEFMEDTREGFQKAGEALLALEKDPAQTERLNEVFRVVHTLKSSSAMLGFAGVSSLANCLEDLLDRVRGKELPVNRDLIDLVLEGLADLEKR